MARSSSGESLLSRVMRILEAFGGEMPALSITEIAERADLPLSTAHRLVHDMLEHGMLERGQSGRIRMGTRLWEMGIRSSRVGLREAAMPVMENLHAVVQQHVQLAVLVDDEVLYIERLSAKGSVVNVAKTASRLPPYACSSGIVLVAFGPDELAEKVLAGPFVRYTSRSVTDAGRLRSMFANARRFGYGLAPGLIVYGSKGIAVPVRESTGAVIAALSIVIPYEADHLKLVPMLKAGARTISRSMGAPEPFEGEVTRAHTPLP